MSMNKYIFQLEKSRATISIKAGDVYVPLLSVPARDEYPSMLDYFTPDSKVSGGDVWRSGGFPHETWSAHFSVEGQIRPEVIARVGSPSPSRNEK